MVFLGAARAEVRGRPVRCRIRPATWSDSPGSSKIPPWGDRVSGERPAHLARAGGIGLGAGSGRAAPAAQTAPPGKWTGGAAPTHGTRSGSPERLGSRGRVE